MVRMEDGKERSTIPLYTGDLDSFLCLQLEYSEESIVSCWEVEADNGGAWVMLD